MTATDISSSALTNSEISAILCIATGDRNMAKSITTSFRLPPELKEQLEHAAQAMHRGKNWIIIQALQSYLAQLDNQLLAKEAKRQSRLASRQHSAEDDDWEANIAINEEDE